MEVLVVGHGPSYRNFEFIREFDGLILSVDFSGKDLVEHGIIPDYILFSEINEGVIDYIDHSLPQIYKGLDITFIHKAQLTKPVIKIMDDMGLRHETFFPAYNGKAADDNVGLYSIAYAHMVLKADEIHLIGLDYKGTDHLGHDHSDAWIRQAKSFVDFCKPKIIDHSGGNFPKS